MTTVHPSWVVIAAGVSAALHVGKLPPALPVLQEALGVTLVQGGFLISMMQFAGMSLGLLIGLGADSLGLRRSVLAGLVTLCVASLLGGWVTSVPALLGLRALEGLGFLLAVMPAPALIRRHLEANQLSARMGYWGAFMPTGTALAFLSGPLVIAAWGWPVWWWLLAALSAGAALAVGWWVPPDPGRNAVGQSSVVETRGSKTPLPDRSPLFAGWWQRLKTTLRSPGPWWVALAFGAYSSQWMAVIGFLPIIYREAGLSAGLTGVLTGCVALVNISGNVMSGRLLQRGWTAPRLLKVGFGGMALGAAGAFVEIGGNHLPLELRFASVLLLSSVGGLIPGTLFSLSVRLAPGESTVSTTVGLVQQSSSTGQFLGPPLVVWLAAGVGGWQYTWCLTGLLCVGGWWLANRIQRMQRA